MTHKIVGTPVAFISVSNRERALTFYRDVLGFELRSSDGFGDFIQLEGALLRVTVLPDYQVRDIVATVHDPDGNVLSVSQV